VYLGERYQGIIDPSLVDPVLEPYQNSHRIKRDLCPRDLVQQTYQVCTKHNPQLVIAEYIFTAPCLDVTPPGTLKIIDTHDMFSRRNPNEALYCTPEEERNYLLKADLIMAIQNEEARMFQALVPERNVITIGVDYDVASASMDSELELNTAMIAASDNNANVLGVDGFCSNAWPLVQKELPDARLRIIGKVCEKVVFSNERIQSVGWVVDLKKEYGRAQIVINPTQYGTGLKIKTVEALCNGKAFVGTPNSVEGLPDEDPKPYIVCPDWERFANSIVQLMTSQQTRIEYEKRAREYASKHFISELCYAPLHEIIKPHLEPVLAMQ
jgi:hypothetical protein